MADTYHCVIQVMSVENDGMEKQIRKTNEELFIYNNFTG